MDTWVADLAALTEHLDLRDAIHIGHSTGGGEVARYVARHQQRVAKAALVASLTPNMYRSADNPSGQPPEWFEAIRAGVLGNRSEFYRFVPENPFYGYNRDERSLRGDHCELVASRHGRRCPRSLRNR